MSLQGHMVTEALESLDGGLSMEAVGRERDGGKFAQNACAPEAHQCLQASVCVLVAQSCLTLWPHGLQPTRLFCPWDSPGKNTGVGCHFLLQGIFPTQELNPRLLHCGWILSCLSHQGSPPRQCASQDWCRGRELGAGGLPMSAAHTTSQPRQRW